MEEKGALDACLHISAAPSTPYPREIGGPPCMIRFLNSRLAATSRGSSFCLLSLLMEQFCLSCSAAHYPYVLPGARGQGPRRPSVQDPSRPQSCPATVTCYEAIPQVKFESRTFC